MRQASFALFWVLASALNAGASLRAEHPKAAIPHASHVRELLARSFLATGPSMTPAQGTVAAYRDLVLQLGIQHNPNLTSADPFLRDYRGDATLGVAFGHFSELRSRWIRGPS